MIKTDEMVYEPWTDGIAVGFKCTTPEGRVSYVYLNPSTHDSEGTPNIFVYNDVDEPDFCNAEIFIVPASHETESVDAGYEVFAQEQSEL